MAQHAHERSSSAYILNSTAQNHPQHQPTFRRHVADSSSNTTNSIYCYSYKNQRPAHLQQRRSVSRMSRPARNAVPPKTDLAKDFVLQAYYQNFHHAHPIMLPLFLLRGPLGKRIPVPILQIMRYVGQHYQSGSKPSPPDGFIDNALSALDSSPPTEQNGFHVQGMILLAICAHAHGKRDLAISIIRKAAELALNLGMHTEAFIGSDAHDSPHIKEMWRRTYWELYVVDALLSALGGRVSSLYSPTSDVLLPCDQALTIEPNSEPPRPSGCTFENIKDNWPLNPGFGEGLPSFAYRILAAYLLGCVLTHGTNSSPTTRNVGCDLGKIDEALSEFRRQDVVQMDLDHPKNATHFQEMIFQARVIANSAYIHLYRPRSALIYVPSQDSVLMGSFPPGYVESKPIPTPEVLSNVLSQTKSSLLDAARSIAHLLTSPVHDNKHSPFLINAATLSVVVLMAARHSPDPSDKINRGLYKDHIKNVLGVLVKMEKTWPWMRSTRISLNRVYKECFPSGDDGSRS